MSDEIQPAPVNPYPGFRPFEPEDEDYFFGRETHADELLGRLHQNRFIAVLGVSGSGKSSLIRAGMIPKLRAGFLTETVGGWRIAVMRPGTEPIKRLADTLRAVDAGSAPENDAELRSRLTAVTLRRTEHGLIDAVRELRLPAGANVLLVVDQFEELFRFRRTRGIADSEDEAQAFVKLLLAATAQTETPIYVVMTMRSDFLGECSDFPSLTRAINSGQYLVPRMTRREMRLAVDGPARVVGERVSGRLVQRLLNEAGDDPDMLPLLQHALMRTFDAFRREGATGEIDFRHYEAIGGLREAVALHAEEAYAELDPADQQRCARIFRALTVREPGHGDVRRPTALKDLAAIVGCEPDQAIRVIDAFRRPGRSFLQPGSATPLGETTMVDLAHESLMRAWPRLQTWVAAESESAGIFIRLSRAAELHARGEGPRYWDPALQIALDWREQDACNEAWAERYGGGFELAMAFLESSDKKKREVVQRIREARAQSLRTSRIVTVGFIALFVLTVAIAIFSYLGVQQASRVAKRVTTYGTNVEQLGWRVERDLLEARRREKDFLLRWELEGFDQAEATYVQENLTHLAAIEASIARLQKHVADEQADGGSGPDGSQGQSVATGNGLLEISREMQSQVDIYRKSFLAVVAQSERLGFQDTGLESEFRREVHQVETILEDTGDVPGAADIIIQLLEIRRNEKDFLLRRGVGDVAEVEDRVRALLERVGGSALPETARRAIAGHLTAYAKKFQGFVNTSRALSDTIEAMRAAAHQIQTVAGQVRARGLEESLAAAARAEVEYQWQVTIGKIVLAILSCILVIGVILAVILFAQLRRPDDVAQLLGLSDSAEAA